MLPTGFGLRSGAVVTTVYPAPQACVDAPSVWWWFKEGELQQKSENVVQSVLSPAGAGAPNSWWGTRNLAMFIRSTSMVTPDTIQSYPSVSKTYLNQSALLGLRETDFGKCTISYCTVKLAAYAA